MKFYDLKDSTKKLFALDIFHLLGLSSLDDAKKKEMNDTLTRLILDYFFEQKLPEGLTREQMEEMMKNNQLNDEKSIDALFEEIGDKMPDASEKFVDAILEVKARFIKEQIVSMKNSFERLLEKEADEAKKKLYQDELDICDMNLSFIEADKWEMINAFED